MSGRQQCFLPAKECKFVLDIVDSIDSLLTYNLPYFKSLVYASLKYDSQAQRNTAVKVTLEGYVMFTYYVKYKRPYPTVNRFQEEIDRINDIWDELGYPEKKISS